MFDRARDLWARYGAAGVAARIWSRTFGLIVDVDLTTTVRVPLPVSFSPLPGYRYERVVAGTPRFVEAAVLLHVDPRERLRQEAYVAIAADDSVVACTFNDPVSEQIAHGRGTNVALDHRGRSLGGNIIRYFAQEVARQGAREARFHVVSTNHSSRRMLQKLGAQPIERWIFVILFRRFRFGHRFNVSTSPRND